MLRYLIVVLTYLSACIRDTALDRYLESFKETTDIVDFRAAMFAGQPMTRSEAINYVLKGDTSKLYCLQRSTNMETETKGPIVRELYLPEKCVKVSKDKFVLIGYSVFGCNGPDDFPSITLTLQIVTPMDRRVHDALTVYSGNEIDWTATGLLNPDNLKIFIIREIGKTSSDVTASMIGIGSDLKFKVVRSQDDVTNMTDNLKKNLKNLGWYDEFFSPN